MHDFVILFPDVRSASARERSLATYRLSTALRLEKVREIGKSIGNFPIYRRGEDKMARTWNEGYFTLVGFMGERVAPPTESKFVFPFLSHTVRLESKLLSLHRPHNILEDNPDRFNQQAGASYILKPT